MKNKTIRIIAAILMLSFVCGCHSDETTAKKKKKVKKTEKTEESSTVNTSEPSEKPTIDSGSDASSSDFSDPTDTSAPSDPGSGPNADGSTELTMFIATYNYDGELDPDNVIQQKIADYTGVRVKEKYLDSNVDSDELIKAMIAAGEIPDLVYTFSGRSELFYDQGLLVPWDEYLADPEYQNLRDLYTDKQWELFRQDDGHIYWADVNAPRYGEDRTQCHDELAFWIQVRVLEWAGYPKIETLDEYFDLLERYYAEHSENIDGTPIIPYTMLCEDWRNFCIEHAPILLDGYADDGPVGVNKQDYSSPKVVDCNVSDTAMKYFRILNEEYQKGIVDPGFADMDYDAYIAKLQSGAVLGMCDMWWDFTYNIGYVFGQNGYGELGYDYVPLGLTIEKGMENRWHSYGISIDVSSGLSVTTACKDPNAAFTFLNRILDQDILNHRFWGIEGDDYIVNPSGYFYRLDDMRVNWNDPSYKASHVCQYYYLPKYKGTSKDGLNAMLPDDQISEIFINYSDPLINCFDAYGFDSYVDFLGSEVEENGPWFPLYTYSNNLSFKTDSGKAFADIKELKLKSLPEIVKASDFDSAWKQYLKEYEACNPQAFLDDMQRELDQRIADS
ncbi:MAG: sugar ABC transporter substrate-binding protein [Clostridiales bacterium]|nr:sugar ABC transporter substrate-binding protein [Clostridiales bacterium]